jgi:hypothetical protein
MKPTPAVAGTVPRTIRLDAQADAILQELCPTRNGAGVIVSQLLRDHQMRRRLAAKYERLAAREQWEGSGIENV